MRTNWDKFYNFRDKFFGFFADEQKQIFPGELFVYVDKWGVKKPNWAIYFAKQSQILSNFPAKISLHWNLIEQKGQNEHDIFMNNDEMKS